MSTQKTKVPDGKGGWSEMEGELMKGGALDEKKQAEALGKTFFEDAGLLTEKLSKFGVLYCKDHGLTPEHLAFAIQLLGVNIREDFPGQYGGSARFDDLGRAASDYYDANAPKKG